MNFIKRLTLSLTVGYILYFYSERMFWSFFQHDEPLSVHALTWLLYSLFTYMFLAIITYFKVRTIWALFLAGTAFGWITEGIYAMTFFGIGGMPLPFSIVWTGIAWHALISVLIGWYYLQLSLANRGYLHTLGFSALLGLFWGVWAVAWIFETPPVTTTPEGFVIHALGTTVLLAFFFWLTPRLHPGSFLPTKWEYRILLAIAVLFTAGVTTPTVLFAVPILLIAFAVVFFVLYKNKKKEVLGTATVLTVFDQRPSFLKCLCLLAMPIVASIVYIGLNAAGLVFASNILGLFASCGVGVVMFAISVYKILKKQA